LVSLGIGVADALGAICLAFTVFLSLIDFFLG